MNIAEVEEVMGGEPVFGYLTSATRLEPGDAFSARGVRALRAEAEVAVELGRDVGPTDGPEAVRAAIADLAPAHLWLPDARARPHRRPGGGRNRAPWIAGDLDRRIAL